MPKTTVPSTRSSGVVTAGSAAKRRTAGPKSATGQPSYAAAVRTTYGRNSQKPGTDNTLVGKYERKDGGSKFVKNAGKAGSRPATSKGVSNRSSMRPAMTATQRATNSYARVNG